MTADSEPKVREILLPGDVILTRGFGLLDFLIRLGQALARKTLRPSPFSHAAISTGPMTVIDADVGKRLRTRRLDVWLKDVAFDDAIVYRRPPSADSRTISKVAKSVAEEEVADPKYSQLEAHLLFNAELVQMAMYFLNRSYNWLFLFTKKNKAIRTFFCSEFVITVCQRADPLGFSALPEKILPIDLPGIFSHAGWSARRLRDLYIVPMAEPDEDLLPIAEMPESLQKVFKENPKLEFLYTIVLGSNGFQQRHLEMLTEVAKKQIESESLQIHVSETIGGSLDFFLEYWVKLAQQIGRARSDKNKVRLLLKSHGIPAHPDRMPLILDWLIGEIDYATCQETSLTEQTAQHDEEHLKLLSVRLAFETVRVSLVVDELAQINAELRDLGVAIAGDVEGNKAKRLGQASKDAIARRMHGLALAFPYLLTIDCDLENSFMEKVDQCVAKLAGQIAQRTRSDTGSATEIFDLEIKLLTGLNTTGRVFGLSRLFRKSNTIFQGSLS